VNRPSATREPYLKRLAAETGLDYVHLDGPGGLAASLRAAATPRPLPGRLDPRPALLAAALALTLLALLAGPLARALRALRGRAGHSAPIPAPIPAPTPAPTGAIRT